MSKFVAVAALVFVLWPASIFAQFGGMGGMGGGMAPGMGGMGMGGPAMPSWPEQEWKVNVETTDGKSVSGTLALVSVPVDCALGRYHIRPEKIKSVRFTQHMPQPAAAEPAAAGQPGAAARPGALARGPFAVTGRGMVEGTVTTAAGEPVEGTVLVWNWTLTTDIGEATLDPSKLKAVTFSGKADAPATKKKETPATP